MRLFLLLLALLPCARAACTPPATCVPHAGYHACVPLCIDNAQVPNTDQTDFTVWRDVTFANWATVGNGGQVQHTTTLNGVTVPADLVFTSDNGPTLSPGWEIVKYTATTGEMSFYVRLPTVKTGSATNFYASYGNSSQTTYPTTACNTWNSNFAGVWHLEDNAGNSNLFDSTCNAVTEVLSTGNSSTYSVAGEVGNAINLGAGSTAYAASGVIAVAAFPVTMSGFMQKANFMGGMVFTGYVPTTAGNTGGYWAVGSPVQFFDSLVGGNCTSGTAFTTGIWNYFAVTGTANNGGTGACYAGRVGTDTSLHRDTGTTANISGTPTVFQLGLGSTGQGQFNGMLDEVRWSKVVRSADWLNTEYNNLTSPSTFVFIGSQSVAVAPANPTIISGTLGPI